MYNAKIPARYVNSVDDNGNRIRIPYKSLSLIKITLIKKVDRYRPNSLALVDYDNNRIRIAITGNSYDQALALIINEELYQLVKAMIKSQDLHSLPSIVDKIAELGHWIHTLVNQFYADATNAAYAPKRVVKKTPPSMFD